MALDGEGLVSAGAIDGEEGRTGEVAEMRNGRGEEVTDLNQGTITITIFSFRKDRAPL
jgi:hypothetical protein